MRTPDTTSDPSFTDSQWYFLAEYSLRDLVANLRQRVLDQSVFQALRNLGIPHERLTDIENLLLGIVTRSLAHFDQRRCTSPQSIRLFCQKKALEASLLSEFSSPANPGQALEPSDVIHHSRAEINMGWGYFMIERGRSSEPYPSRPSDHWVDVFLYKEGE